tara:strand:+ start:1868 stop:2131 length:264 start_codon:yes stop_codon:yes gene_type:complete
MKWLVIVVFAGISQDGSRDLYVFTQPTFETEIQCQADITDPAVVPILVQQVIKDNGYRPIEKVICMEENDFIELYKKSWQEENEISL